MRSRLVKVLAAAALVATTACSGPQPQSQHYTSAVTGQAGARINMDAVQQALWQTQGGDFNTWMHNFEERVNQIYGGQEVVSVDADKDPNGYVKVTGYIDRNKVPGYQPGQDDLVFQLTQTAPVQNNQFAYNMSGPGGYYYEGHHSILDNPFVQYMILSHLFRPYYTPFSRTVVIERTRTVYRQSPAYASQQRSNSGFFGRQASSGTGQARSSRGWGTGGTGSKNRSWTGGTTGSSGGGSSWGGRRSSSWGSSGGSGYSGGSSGGWGGRRGGGSFGGGSFGGGRSWGGRRR